MAHILNRLKVFDYEFDSWKELNDIVKTFNEEINTSIHKGTKQIPREVFLQEEQSKLIHTNIETLKAYFSTNRYVRKVTKESLVCFCEKKYSVPTEYISETVICNVYKGKLTISLPNGFVICEHQLSDKLFNYKQEHYRDILKHTISDSEAIEKICSKNLNIFDKLGD